MFSSFFLLHTFPLFLSSLFFLSFYLHLSGAFPLIFTFLFSFLLIFFSRTMSTPKHLRSITACRLPTEAQMGQFCFFFYLFIYSNLISFKILIWVCILIESSFFLLHTFPLSLSSLFFLSFYLHLSGAFPLIFTFLFSFLLIFFSRTTSTPKHLRSTTTCPLPIEAQMGQFCFFFLGSNLISFKILIWVCILIESSINFVLYHCALWVFFFFFTWFQRALW